MSDDPILAALARLETGQAAMFSRLERLEDGQAALATGMERLEAGQAALTTRLDRFDAGQTRLRADLMDRMDRLQDQLTDMRNDIAVNFGTADAAHRANDNTREQLSLLREQVSVMYQQIKRLEARVREITGDP